MRNVLRMDLIISLDSDTTFISFHFYYCVNTTFSLVHFTRKFELREQRLVYPSAVNFFLFSASNISILNFFFHITEKVLTHLSRNMIFNLNCRGKQPYVTLTLFDAKLTIYILNVFVLNVRIFRWKKKKNPEIIKVQFNLSQKLIF